MNTPQNDTAEQPSRWQRFQNSVVWEYIQVAMVAFVLVFGFIRPFIIEPFKIPSGSMENTLLIGDRILVCKFIYGIRIPGTDIKLFDFHKPARGDVFVFIPPHEKAKNFIKRVVAIEGDAVETTGDTLRINGKAIDDRNYTKHVAFPHHRRNFPPFLRPQFVPDGEAFADFKFSHDRFYRKFPNGKPFSVPEDFVFAMGDNRDQSSDSRTWGPATLDNVKGQAFMVYWSFDHIGRRVKPWAIWEIPKRIRFNRIGKLIRSEFDGNQK